jgi:hypothetical protein
MAQQPYLESAFKLAQIRLAELKNDRQSWESHWRELQNFFLTRRGRWITDSKTQRGEKRNQNLVDPTPRIAARTLGAGMHAGSTNPASPWLKLTTPDPEMMELPGVARWLYSIENWMRDVFERSNLYSVLPNIYTESGVFGTAPMLMLEHPTKVINFVPKTIGSYYLAKNSDGVVDTMYCEYTMTTRQLVNDFGIDNVSSVVKSEWEQGKRAQLHDVLHIIEPRDGSKSYSAKDMPWKSCYYELKHGEEKALRESGFEENPIAAFLWETTEITDPYGSSCGMDALGCAKAMQIQQKRKAQAIDKLVDPPMVGDPALKNQPSTLLPGDVTWAGFTQNGSAPKFQPAYTIKPELQGLMIDIEDIRDLVSQAMYTDLFFAITRADPRNASVPEIDARKEEQILALGPVLQNHVAFIKAVVDRTFYIGMRQGRLPPPPPELEGIDLKVELTGALAQAFKAIAGQKIERFAMYVGSIAKAQADSGQAVTAWDKFDAEQSIDEYGLAIGVPPSVIRSDDAVAEIQEARARAQREQAMAEQAAAVKDGAQAAKALSETKMGQGSALDEVVEAA